MPFQEDGKMDISESTMEKAILDFLEGADADAIAYVAGIMFGGECAPYFKEYPNGQHWLTYDFKPNMNYSGAFDK